MKNEYLLEFSFYNLKNTASNIPYNYDHKGKKLIFSNKIKSDIYLPIVFERKSIFEEIIDFIKDKFQKK